MIEKTWEVVIFKSIYSSKKISTCGFSSTTTIVDVGRRNSMRLGATIIVPNEVILIPPVTSSDRKKKLPIKLKICELLVLRIDHRMSSISGTSNKLKSLRRLIHGKKNAVLAKRLTSTRLRIQHLHFFQSSSLSQPISSSALLEMILQVQLNGATILSIVSPSYLAVLDAEWDMRGGGRFPIGKIGVSTDVGIRIEQSLGN